MQNRRIFIKTNRMISLEGIDQRWPDGQPQMDFHGTLSLSHGLPIGFAAKTNVRGLSWPPTMLGLELVLSNDVLLQYDLYIYMYRRYMWKLQEAGFDFGNCTRKLLRNDENCQQFIKFRASLRNWTLSISYDIWECQEWQLRFPKLPRQTIKIFEHVRVSIALGSSILTRS